MDAKEAVERKRFVDAALSWLSTPYHHGGQVKGAGVDCATLLVCSAREAGLLPEGFQLGNYSSQWNVNRTAQTYLAKIGEACKEVPPPPQPGDIVVFQFGRIFSHGAIVVEWPRIIHALLHQRVTIDDVERAKSLLYMGELDGRPRPMKIMSLWPR